MILLWIVNIYVFRINKKCFILCCYIQQDNKAVELYLVHDSGGWEIKDQEATSHQDLLAVLSVVPSGRARERWRERMEEKKGGREQCKGKRGREGGIGFYKGLVLLWWWRVEILNRGEHSRQRCLPWTHDRRLNHKAYWMEAGSDLPQLSSGWHTMASFTGIYPTFVLRGSAIRLCHTKFSRQPALTTSVKTMQTMTQTQQKWITDFFLLLQIGPPPTCCILITVFLTSTFPSTSWPPL